MKLLFFEAEVELQFFEAAVKLPFSEVRKKVLSDTGVELASSEVGEKLSFLDCTVITVYMILPQSR